jgi:uncharacterized protein involved in exopolysaccharide biosynthesis/Mrp family chromosome partitioning ATPase
VSNLPGLTDPRGRYEARELTAFSEPQDQLRPTPAVRMQPADPGPGSLGLDLVHAYHLLRRRLRLALLVALVVGAAAILAISQLPRRYTAETMLVLDPRRSKVDELMSGSETLLSRTQSDLSAIRTQTELLLSPDLLREVVRQLNLTQPPPGKPSLLETWLWPGLQSLGDPIERLRSWLPTPAAGTPEPLDFEQTVGQLGRAVTIVNEGGSYVIRVRAEAGDPELAARIANSVAQGYLDDQRRAEQAARDADAEWLRQRLEDLRARVIASEDAVEAFRAEAQLGTEAGKSVLDRQIEEVNTALIGARTQLTRVEASFNQLQAAASRGVADESAAVMNSATVLTLRGQEAELLSERAQLTRSLGPRHPQLLDLDAELAGVRAKIRAEADRVVASARSDLEAARAEVVGLESQLARLEDQRGGRADATVKLAELTRQAQAAQDVYQQFLEQFTAAMARANAASASETRIVAAARPPAEPSGPPRKLMAAGAGMASIGIGVLVALGLGYLRGGFARAEDLAAVSGLPVLGLVPELSRRELAATMQWPDAPVATTALRSVAYVLASRRPPATLKPVTLLLTSAARDEGKSFCADQLATALASLNARVLLVELDYWSRRSGTRWPPASPPAMDTAQGVSEGGQNLDVLPIEPGLFGQEPGAALRSRLASLKSLNKAYDFVLLDGPAVLETPEALPAATSADQTLLLVRFEQTRARQVRAALDRLAAVGVQPLGTMLTRIVRVHYRRYGYGEVA